jgi:hypothetical protein
MRARRTHRSNKVFTLPGGTEDNDLWVEVMRGEPSGHLILCSTWVPTDEERKLIAEGHNIDLLIWGSAQPPVLLRTTDTPIGKPPEA